jgi:hypothetical protein
MGLIQYIAEGWARRDRRVFGNDRKKGKSKDNRRSLDFARDDRFSGTAK